MPRLYANQRVNFGIANDSDIPRYQYHRTLRNAIELSATSYSYQEINDGKPYQWDNIAPEVALVILQDAEKKGLLIRQEVIDHLGSAAEFNTIVLRNALTILNGNPDYLLFTQKLALHICGKPSTQLRVEELNSAGITTIEQFDEIYSKFLLEQKKLTKNFPNFEKIKASDDYDQVINFLANNPLYDKFLKSFTERLAFEFNRNLNKSHAVQPLTEITKESLFKFLGSIGYSLILKSPGETLRTNTLYVEIIDNELRYTVMTPDGQKITDTIGPGQLGIAFSKHTSEEELKNTLPSILKITAQRGHTGEFALNSILSLKTKGADYLSGNVHHDLFLSHLPSLDLVKDEGYKFTLYYWLAQNNLSKLKNHIVEGAFKRYCDELDLFVEQAKEPFIKEEEFKKEVNSISFLMKEIVDIIASLDANPNEKDSELDEKISKLTKHLKWLKGYYTQNPFVKPGEIFPTTEGNFDNFVKKIIFNSTSDKVIRYVSDKEDKSKIWKLDLVEIVHHLINDRVNVLVRNIKDKKTITVLAAQNGQTLSPLQVLREQIKENVSTRLKNNTHHYYTFRSYKNDNLPLHQAPVSFRGGNLTNTLDETRTLAKHLTRRGEFTADSHLLIGQENNVKKHEVRSGTAASLFAATGVDGTRSTTDKFKIAIQFGGDKDVRIMYILRGKQAFHSHSYLDPFGKNKFSEIAYTHLDPSDYVMTILYDKNNTILDVIPGNLTDEIHGISDFTKQVLSAGIEFYNVKHNPNYKSTIRLPNPEQQRKTPTDHLHTSKSFIDIVQSHKITPLKKEGSNMLLGSVRIRRGLTADGHKKLLLDTLRPETKMDAESSTNQTLPSIPFKHDPDWLVEVRAQAQRHYNMRHVLTLKNFSGWSDHERKLQEEHNRILQPGFMIGDINTQLTHAAIAKVEWLTDALAPKVQTALLLNIAARLITDYQVDVEELNTVVQKLHQTISDKYTLELADLEGQISNALDIFNESGHYKQCLQKAKERMIELYPVLKEDTQEYKNNFASCLEIEKNKVRKKVTNEVVSAFLDKHLDEHTTLYKLEKKTVYPVADNRDFVFLGAAASGKSTISSQYFSPETKKNYVSLATDDYRGICLPYTNNFESQQIDQVFIRTQDSAYLISELVEERMKSKGLARPNVIVDGVTYKPSHRELIEKNKNSVIVCACLDDVAQVVKRSYERARQEDAGSADRGRYINTSELINMHKTASFNLIKYCAPNSTVAFYDTNVPRGTKPPLIATIDTHGAKTLTISNETGALMRLASFFNKSRVNVGAKSDDSLFFKKLKKAAFQVDSLFTVMDFGYKILLNNENNHTYLAIEKGSNGKITMDIKDADQLKAKMQDSTSSECQLLKWVLLYGHYGNLKEVNKQCLLHDSDVDLLVDKFFASMPETIINTGLDCDNLSH